MPPAFFSRTPSTYIVRFFVVVTDSVTPYMGTKHLELDEDSFRSY